ncbi:hypothetical protein AAFM46_09610 [Arthrobacter sp. TMP15]|uniref:P-loop ATPase, Sll1717 family n=1 Tax=Arthrobacter sp. TMP15 TaxID=3140789 RepID=UPI0031B9CE43
MKFKDIEFGFKSAEAERKIDPDLLLDGFFHKGDIINEICNGVPYFILGYKGSGKSSIAEHLSLLSTTDPTLFVNLCALRDFPFEQVPEVISATGDKTVRTNLGWSILLVLKIFESISEDNEARRENPEIDSLASKLRKLGLLPKRKLRDLVLVSREIDLSLALPKALTASMKDTYKEPVLVLSQVRDVIMEMVIVTRTTNQHILFLDGLDEIFYKFEDSYFSLASLVHEVDALNSDFSNAGVPIKVVLLCRTDVFERLPSPNINKLRDFTITLVLLIGIIARINISNPNYSLWPPSERLILDTLVRMSSMISFPENLNVAVAIIWIPTNFYSITLAILPEISCK